MNNAPLSGAKQKIVNLLKRQGATTAAQLAKTLKLTDVAIRQHLHALESDRLARPRKQPADGRGRPSLLWELTEPARQLFPDRHGELTVGLLDAMRHTFGEGGLERVVRARASQQVRSYRAFMPSEKSSLKARVESLAKQRTAEGYMAEVLVERPGCYLLIEHHCPICEAASSCLLLCSAELEVFRETLGPNVEVERTTHLLSGDERCVYRIQKN